MMTATLVGTGVASYIGAKVGISNLEGKKKRLANTSLKLALFTMGVVVVQFI